MKIIFVFRPRTARGFSIENVFLTLMDELRAEHEVIPYHMGQCGLFGDVRALRRLRGDVYHITGGVNFVALLLPRHKTVLTIHDIAHYTITLRGLRKLLYKWFWLSWPIRRARAVTAVSETTADAMMRYLDIGRDRVHVIRNCIHPGFFDIGDKKALQVVLSGAENARVRRCWVVLQVGTARRKNVVRVVEALHGLNVEFWIVGRITEEIRTAATKYRIDVRNFVNVDQHELLNLYRDADLVTFLSLEGEGFGLPIVEAQASRTLVLTSDRPPMRDVCGISECVVDPRNISRIRAKIIGLMGGGEGVSRVLEAGLLNAQKYKPCAVAEEYVNLYKEL